VQVQVAADSISMGSVPTTSSSTTGCNLATNPTCKNEAQASVGSPLSGTLTYGVWVDAVQVVDLTIDVSLGTVVSHSIYGPTPAAG
jgi:hypothetical protein